MWGCFQLLVVAERGTDAGLLVGALFGQVGDLLAVFGGLVGGRVRRVGDRLDDPPRLPLAEPVQLEPDVLLVLVGNGVGMDGVVIPQRAHPAEAHREAAVLERPGAGCGEGTQGCLGEFPAYLLFGDQRSVAPPLVIGGGDDDVGDSLEAGGGVLPAG